MIPYIHVPDLEIGPIPLHPFGLLVATGVLIGTSLATRRARRLGVDLEKLNSFIMSILVFGFAGAHMLDQIFYHPDELARRPLSLIMLWEGLSSFGGFTGGLIGAILWRYFDWKVLPFVGLPYWPVKRAAPLPVLPMADIIVAVFPVAWIFGRSGCSTVHDHPGARTTADAFLAVAYPSQNPSVIDGPGVHHALFAPIRLGGIRMEPIQLIEGHFARYDLGLLELLFTIGLAGLLALTWHKKLPTGSYVVAVCLAYAPVRFALDFLRIADMPGADPRYGGLTPAQWSCVAMFVYGIVMLVYVRRLKARGIDPIDRVRAVEAPPPPADAAEVA